MKKGIVVTVSEQNMNNAIEAIMEDSHKMEAVPAPIGLRISDILSDNRVDDQVGQLWIQMARLINTGSGVRNLRLAMGLNQNEFARLWGSTQANLSIMENRNGKLQVRSKEKLVKLVQDYIEGK